MVTPSIPTPRPITAAILGVLISAVPLSAAAASPPHLTTTLFIPASYYPGPGYRSTYASVIVVDATATTYRLDCTPGGGDDDYLIGVGEFDAGCEDWPSVTLTVGPSIAQVMASAVGKEGGVHETQGMVCKVDPPAPQAICDFISYGNSLWTGHYPLHPITGTEFAIYSQAVTITEGMDKLLATTATTTDTTGTASVPATAASVDNAPKTTTGSEALIPGGAGNCRGHG